ncbi:ABC transporter ATP-binding protein [Neobacillus terrae]|uniref:ABC transporter ATP-binding protein n=1 Tax=Neobacillus terrae TaxID=3034837 RepID=UPI0014085572|nr:ABC transporter ATP-binding protein [Neobacillus terrae]NHM29354.1 ABC transporter ATP-binding protein [Neobacillus terrae]
MTLVEVSGLKKSFHGTEVIKGLDFSLERGKCIALLGPNGAGKTTTLRMLSGLMKPTSGSISFSNYGKGEDIRHLIGYLPQFPVYFDWMTAKEFLQYVGRLAGLSSREAKGRTMELLKRVGIEEATNRRIAKFSGGMKQRLGIAQALIHRPLLLMLDEPVSALDPFGRREVLELLEELKKETTILFSTHILNDAEEVCDKILFLHKGRIVESGTMEELMYRYTEAKIDFSFNQKADKYETLFAASPLVNSFKIQGDTVTVEVTNLEKARSYFLNRIAEENWSLSKFEISSMTLEDIFMKVVGNDEPVDNTITKRIG